jgi:TonB-linked SusC/RagA family outer membrane protein
MKKVLLALSFLMVIGLGNLFAQAQTVTGTVTGSDDGMPIPGVSVFVKGTTVGTVTQPDGTYSLRVPDDAETIVFSFVGMQTQEIPYEGQSTIDVQLVSESFAMDEVVVVAYGTATKEAFTGSAGKIESGDISKRQVSNITNSMAGQVAGVQVTNSNGQPGTGSSVRIRGIGSMSASNNPLYIVDGVPYDGSLSAINPNDIESMSVLKDAAASAIYGARGANGVVIITTKKGESKEAVITVDSKWGTNSRAVPNYEVMSDPAMYYETFYQALYNSQAYRGASAADAHEFARNTIFDKDNGGLGYQVYTVPEGEYFIGTNGKLNPSATLGYSDEDYYYTPDDWYDELFDEGNMRQEYNISISGSSDKIDYYFSGGFLDDSGIVSGSGFERFTGRSKVDYQAKEWLKVGANIGYTYYNIKAPTSQTSWGSSGNLFYVSNMIAPIYPMYVRNKDGSIKKDDNGITVYDFGTTTNQARAFMGLSNPAITLKLDQHDAHTDVLASKWYGELTILEGLQLNANIGVNVINQRESHLYNPFYGAAVSDQGSVYVSHERNLGINQQYLLKYRTKFDAHNLDLLAGYESYDLTMQDLSADSKNLYNPDVAEIGNAIYDPPNVDSYTDKYETMGFLARVQYDYNEKIFASASYRRDASSRFAPENRWGDFGSFGAAWVVSKENFFSNLGASWLDFFKLKASYGMQGNDNLLYQGAINYYPYLDQYEVTNSDGDFSTSLIYKGNYDITWETSHSFNAGIEFTILNDLVEGDFEYFSRKTTDMLYYQPVPVSLGYPTIPMNVGSVINKGVEGSLDFSLLKRNNLAWRFNVNATSYTNEVLELAENVKETGIKGSTSIIEEGGSLYDSFLREYAGVDRNTGKALYYMVDDDGDYVLDENGNKTTTDSWSDTNQRNMGSTLAKVYGGFGTSFDFYGFDLSLAFSYQLGGKVYDFSYEELMHSGDGAGVNWHKDILDAWTPQNRDTDVPRLNSLDDTYQKLSSRFLLSSDYLALNNVTFGYTLPERWTEKINLKSARIYFSGENLFLLTKRKGIDPRQSFGGTSYTAVGSHNYSALRTISGGVSISF